MERNNKQTCVKLFAELSNSAKNTAPAPIASFVTKLLISFPPNQKVIEHPGNCLLLLPMYVKDVDIFSYLIFNMQLMNYQKKVVLSSYSYELICAEIECHAQPVYKFKLL